MTPSTPKNVRADSNAVHGPVWLFKIKTHPEWLLIPAVFIVFIGLWEAIIRFYEVPIYIMPAPSNIALALGNTSYLDNALTTLSEALLGFLAAAFSGLVLGALIAQFPLLEKTLTSALVILRSFFPLLAQEHLHRHQHQTNLLIPKYRRFS